MKLIGMIGGTTWVSTVDYYRFINQITSERLGGLNSAKLLLYSMNFEEFKPPVDLSKWNHIIEILTTNAIRLEKAGADCIMICANTPHLMADKVKAVINIPFIHIAEAVANTIKANGIKKVALLGTRTTMEQPFYSEKLALQNIETIIPEMEDRQYIHDSIFNELGKNIFLPKTKIKYLEIIGQLIKSGAEGIILGCTEIPLFIIPEDVSVPIFDTTYIHSQAAVDFALN